MLRFQDKVAIVNIYTDFKVSGVLVDYLCCVSLVDELAGSERQGWYVYPGRQKPSCKYHWGYLIE